MVMSVPTIELVTMRGGIVFSVAALQVAWDLEDRGLQLAADGDRLLVGPRGLLTDADRENIRRWQRHLIEIVRCDAGTAGVQ
jgi:hypothetical protein